MRFKKGSKVEVLSKEMPSCSWFPAQVISGNGRSYSVRYDCSSGTTADPIVEKVSRKVIRPSPPVVSVKSWVAGEVVEVFHAGSWRTVVVSKVMGGDYYLVRPLGSLREVKVHMFNIRVRQLWQDDQWFVIGKGSRTCEDVNLKRLSTTNCYWKSSQAPSANIERKVQAEDDHWAGQYNNCLQESRFVSSRTLKRASPYCSSHVDTCTGNIQKMRAIEKEGGPQRVAQSPLLQKVDAVAYPRDNMGEKYIRTSFNKYNEMERGKPSVMVECFNAGSSEPNDFDSDTCSVGSCSVVSESNKMQNFMLRGPSQGTNIPCSDAESCYDWRDEEEENPLFSKEELVPTIHRLELHAYRSTLEAFYASGTFSWEREALLTNLRTVLHISNDEHLMEIKNLVSSGTSFHIS